MAFLMTPVKLWLYSGLSHMEASERPRTDRSAWTPACCSSPSSSEYMGNPNSLRSTISLACPAAITRDTRYEAACKLRLPSRMLPRITGMKSCSCPTTCVRPYIHSSQAIKSGQQGISSTHVAPDAIPIRSRSSPRRSWRHAPVHPQGQRVSVRQSHRQWRSR